MKTTDETAFEAVIEAHLLDNGYVPVAREGFDRDRAIFPEEALTFIRETQPTEWARLVGNELGLVFSVEKVGDEVQAITDELCVWAADLGDAFFLRPDASR